MSMFVLACKSIWNRKFTVLLTLSSIALSMLLLLGVERVRTQLQDSFAHTISGTDLIVGARSGAVQLLLYSVFRIGDATHAIGWESYEYVKHARGVAWAVPMALGDSHRGFRVLATSPEYFTHYRYARDQALRFAQGQGLQAGFDAVIGADVARELGYGLNREIILAHGTGDVSFVQHADTPFRVVGILARTGTPVDRTVHITLAGLEAMHAEEPGEHDVHEQEAHPDSLSAILVGLHSRQASLRVQREINEYTGEPLLAILPAVALQSLWDSLALIHQGLRLISGLVVLVGISGMVAVMLAGLSERRREMAILRSVGARPGQVFVLFMGESAALMLLAAGLGLAALYGLQWLVEPLVQAQLGLHLPLQWPSPQETWLLCLACLAGMLAGAIPAWRAYRYSLADGLTIHI